MKAAPQSMQQLSDLLRKLDGRSFQRYQALVGQCFDQGDFRIRFVHVQGSTGAFPASVVHLELLPSLLDLPDHCLVNTERKLATADYLIRAFTAAVRQHTRPNRGAQGSGSFQPLELPPQVLERNLVRFKTPNCRIAFHISLPGSLDNKAQGRQAETMLLAELPLIVLGLKTAVASEEALKEHCDTVEDMLVLQKDLSRKGWVAFVADGSLLPRRSGVSQRPLEKEAVLFKAPDDLASYVTLPHAGRVRGLGIGKGVTVIIGGGFHGKSTLVDALAKAVYPHIPGDGREQMASDAHTSFVSAEQGRAVSGIDISGFMAQLPGNTDPENFWTQNASGSTSQAAAIIETASVSAKLLLMDEDSSATNFLIRDQQMRNLVPDDPIIPFLDRVRELYQNLGISTLIVAGSSSAYLGVADQVIAMRKYRPVCLSPQVRALDLPSPADPDKKLSVKDRRRLSANNFDPSFQAKRLGKSLAVRIKPLRLHESVLEFGNQQLDLTALRALVDVHQVLAIGYALLLARKDCLNKALSPSGLVDHLDNLIEKEGLAVLELGSPVPLFLARPRRLELAGAINRLRNLKIDFP